MGSRKRPVRTWPIRLTLVGMFVIPLLSLVALWGFAASVTLGPSRQERSYNAEYTTVGRPALALGMIKVLRTAPRGPVADARLLRQVLDGLHAL